MFYAYDNSQYDEDTSFDYYYYYYDVTQLENETWGSLVVEYNGLPGYICPDGWSDEAATVACREMGYAHGQMYLHSNWYDSYYTEFTIWSSNFQCT